MPTSLRILIIEDSLFDAELMIAELEAAGYACRWERVETRAELLTRLNESAFDLALSDYNMPSFDALSALRVFIERGLDIPFILVSGSVGEETAIESLKAGATDYVLKDRLFRLGPVVERALKEKEAQRQRRRAEEALRKSEERYRDLFENANDILYTHDLQGNFTSINKMAELLTGHSRAELVGTNIAEILAPGYAELARENMKKKLEGTLESSTYDLEIVCKDGRLLPLEVSTRLIYEGGQPVGVQGIARDVSERRQAEEQRRRLEEQLLQAQKMESIGRLAGGVAHDFNNLLTAILGYCQLLQGSLDADDPHQMELKEIESAGARAAALTRQLLVFSRRQKPARKTIDVNDAIANLINMLRRIIGEDVEVRLQVGADVPAISADPLHIEQVVMNLAVNARDAMPGGGQLIIETQGVTLDEEYCSRNLWARPGRYARIVVSDTGVGMDAETRQHIFEPFFTTKETGKGTGLGLAVVYGIVEQHGGFINVYSEPGHGTTFKVYFPAEPGAIEETVTEAPPVLRGGSETILVAEDEEVLQRLIESVLQGLGYNVLMARDGEEALSLFAANRDRIALLILDVVMPRMGGPELYRRIVAAGGEAPVIFMTGYSSEMLEGDFSGQKNVSYLQKPYNVVTLVTKVREALDRREA
ncbi:MAG TPA: response regulator [Blastocatellia bacterium]|nr:response regulator [Blastocatellia bacterium]